LGFAPQIPHAPSSLFSKGLLLLQVPENWPFFLTNNFMAIPAMQIPTEPSKGVSRKLYEKENGNICKMKKVNIFST
jgi:hypothetical protein